MNEHLTVEGSQMKCAHCGYIEQLKIPQTMDDFITQMERFDLNHDQCMPEPKPKATGTEHYFNAEGKEYAKGFDHGCHYMLVEIERYERESHPNDRTILALIAHLKKAGGYA
jgi:hypothetical protein